MNTKDKLIEKQKELIKEIDHQLLTSEYKRSVYYSKAMGLHEDIASLKLQIEQDENIAKTETDTGEIVDMPEIYDTNARLAFISGLLQGMNSYLHDKLK